ncbi:MAG: hypothetical protein AAB365_01245 [Patescibacteria group bacterium]
MPLEYIFPDHSVRNHQIRVIAGTALVVVVLVYLFYLVGQKLSPQNDPQSTVDKTAALQKLVSEPNPPANLAPQEVAGRQEIANKPNPPSSLEPGEVQERQATLENI